MKRIVTSLLTVVMLTVGLNTTAFGSGNAQSLSTADFDLGMAKGIQYFNNGQYYEARDEFQWFCDDNWGRMNDGQQQYALDYLGSAKIKCISSEILGWWVQYSETYGNSTQYYIKDNGLIEVYYNERPVHWDGVYSIDGSKIEYSYTVVERTATVINGCFIYKDGCLYDYTDGDSPSVSLVKIPKYMTADELKKMFVYKDNNMSFDDVHDEINLIKKYLDDGLYLEAIERCNYVENNFALSQEDGITIISMRDRANAWYYLGEAEDYISNGMYLEAIERCDYLLSHCSKEALNKYGVSSIRQTAVDKYNDYLIEDFENRTGQHYEDILEKYNNAWTRYMKYRNNEDYEFTNRIAEEELNLYLNMLPQFIK